MTSRLVKLKWEYLTLTQIEDAAMETRMRKGSEAGDHPSFGSPRAKIEADPGSRAKQEDKPVAAYNTDRPG